jgi:hypothetical protein
MTLEDFFRAVPSEDKMKFDKFTKVLQAADRDQGVQAGRRAGERREHGRQDEGGWRAGLKAQVIET